MNDNPFKHLSPEQKLRAAAAIRGYAGAMLASASALEAEARQERETRAGAVNHG